MRKHFWVIALLMSVLFVGSASAADSFGYNADVHGTWFARGTWSNHNSWGPYTWTILTSTDTNPGKRGEFKLTSSSATGNVACGKVFQNYVYFKFDLNCAPVYVGNVVVNASQGTMQGAMFCTNGWGHGIWNAVKSGTSLGYFDEYDEGDNGATDVYPGME